MKFKGDLSTDELREYLSKMTKNELSFIARKHLRLISKLNKQQLIDELMKIDHSQLIKILNMSWWDRNKETLGILTSIFGVIATIATCLPIKDRASVVDIKASLLSKQEALELYPDDYSLSESYQTFEYIDTVSNDVHFIFPNNVYLNNYHNECKASIELCPWWEWIINPHNPIIDIKIANNTNRTLFIDKVIIEVDESKFDDRRLLLFHREQANTSSFLIMNDCWDKWEYFTFNFSFSKTPPVIEQGKNYKYSKRVNYFDFCYEFDLKPYLAQEGLDYEKLKQIILSAPHSIYRDESLDLDINRSLHIMNLDDNIAYGINQILPDIINKADPSKGSFEGHPYVYVDGEVVFPNCEDTVIVQGPIPLTYTDGGAMIEPSKSFNAELMVNGTHYEVEYPISLSIKSQDVDRFTIQLNAEKSSFHKFRFRLDDIAGKSVYSNDINLELFKERTIELKDELRREL